ncbi:MAG: PAS domain S-box protein [Acidimicrobiia bacterium]
MDLRSRSETGLGDDVAWSIVDSAPDGIIVADEAGRVVVVNRQTEEIFGYARDDLLGRSVDDLLPDRFQHHHHAHRTRYRAEPRTRPMGVGLELHGRREDGSEFPVEISLSPLPTDDGMLVVAVVRDVSERAAIEQRLREAERDVHTLEDHERIARDLHDVVIQQLFASGMTLQGVWSRLKEPDIAQRVADVVDDLDRTIREIRTVIFGLQPRREVHGGKRALILDVVADERDALGFNPEVHFDGPVESMPDDLFTELLPTLREALSNVARHAGATWARVAVTHGPDVSLSVDDDGRGIEERASTTGHGLRNMRDRAVRLGGRCDVARRPEGGTSIEWRVPVTLP